MSRRLKSDCMRRTQFTHSSHFVRHSDYVASVIHTTAVSLVAFVQRMCRVSGRPATYVALHSTNVVSTAQIFTCSTGVAKSQVIVNLARATLLFSIAPIPPSPLASPLAQRRSRRYHCNTIQQFIGGGRHTNSGHGRTWCFDSVATVPRLHARPGIPLKWQTTMSEQRHTFGGKFIHAVQPP